MTTTYGVVPTGFVRKTVENILDELEADQVANIAADVDVSSDQPLGQANGTFARQLGIVWEQLENIYHGNDPDVSEDRLLEMLCKLTGTFRRGSTASQVTLRCNLDNGTTLTAGESFAAIIDKPDIRFTPLADFTAPSDGNFDLLCECEQTGPVPADAGTITVIATPVVGWNTVVNPEDAELGKLTDLDPALRLRREQELATIGSATTRAIAANVSQAFPDDIVNLTVNENINDFPDANGLPGHSVEVLIFDGDVPSANNDALAQVIFDSKAGGIKGYGNTSGNAKATINGVESTIAVGFSRAVQLDVYLDITVTAIAGYVGDTALKEYVAAKANAFFAPSAEVIEVVIQSLPLQLKGVKDVPLVKLGYAPSPSASANLAVGFREIARFDTSRIVVHS